MGVGGEVGTIGYRQHELLPEKRKKVRDNVPGYQRPEEDDPEVPLHSFSIQPKYRSQHSLSVASIQVVASSVILWSSVRNKGRVKFNS